MIDHVKISRRVALLRKRIGLTQEQLAERLNVTGQAVSKWENGNALPDISLLPELSRLLGTSIDFLLTPYDLFILEAKYGVNGAFVDVTIQLNSSVDADGLCFVVSNASLGADPAPGLYKYLTVRYINSQGTFFAFAGEGCGLHLSAKEAGLPAEAPVATASASEGIEILAARYGCELLSNDVTGGLMKYIHGVKSGVVPVTHEWFSSPPAVSSAEHLSVLYRNREGVFTRVVPEGGGLGISADGRFLFETRAARPPSNSRKIQGIASLTWGKGMECSFGGALTAALRAMGDSVSYEQVMGVSGACWRLAFCHPNWDPSSVDGLVVYDHVSPAWKAFGYDLKDYDRVDKKDREKVRGEIVASIDRGVPVLAIDLRGEPEWGVIAGYSDDGKTLWCRTYFDGGAQDYLRAEKWPFLLLFFEQKRSTLPAADALHSSLKIFIEEMNIPERRGYTMGYHAYETWSSGLEDDERFASLDDETLKRMAVTNSFCYLSLVDARKAGLAYLQSCQGLLEAGPAAHLDAAVSLYSRLVDQLTEGWQSIPTEEQCAGALHIDWTAEKRACQAAILREAEAIEKRVEQEFRAIV